MTVVSCDALRRALRERRIDWSAPLHCLDRVDSTNRWLLARARGGAPSWSVATARAQAAGRGRQGRRWHSEPGGLFISVLLPAPPPAVLGLVSLSAGTATARAMLDFRAEAEVRLKWPNDVLLGGRKIAGILAEALGPAARLGIVLGVGVNVAVVPPAVDGALPATSLAATGVCPSIESVAAAVLEHLRLCYDAVLRGETQRVLDDWRALSVDWWGRPINVRDGGTLVAGRAVDVDEGGRLVIETNHGERRALSSGDVAELRLQGEMDDDNP